METQVEQETLLTAEEAAEVLRVTPNWIRENTKRDGSGIPAIYLGRQIRYPPAKILLAWAARQSREKRTRKPLSEDPLLTGTSGGGAA
jgi:hypothetical protein